MIVNKALTAVAVLLFTAPVVPALADDDYGDRGYVRCFGIGVCPETGMMITGGVVTTGGIITTGGLTTTVAGSMAAGLTVAGGMVAGNTSPRVLTAAGAGSPARLRPAGRQAIEGNVCTRHTQVHVSARNA